MMIVFTTRLFVRMCRGEEWRERTDSTFYTRGLDLRVEGLRLLILLVSVGGCIMDELSLLTNPSEIGCGPPFAVGVPS